MSSLSLAADVDETDVFLVKPGVKAEAELDAVPGGRYPATVASVGLSPTQSARGGVSYRAGSPSPAAPCRTAAPRRARARA